MNSHKEAIEDSLEIFSTDVALVVLDMKTLEADVKEMALS